MGVINDGSISGVLPSGSSSEAFAVFYPGYPSSTERAIETLGGRETILKARNAKSKLELHFRPEDPYSHPVFGELGLGPSNNFLLKISKKKAKDVPNANEHIQCSEHSSADSLHIERNIIAESTEAGECTVPHPCGSSMPMPQVAKRQIEDEAQCQLSANVIARVPEAYYFNGMVDYQHALPVHADAARKRKHNWAEIDPNFERHSLIDVDQEDLMILLPPLFSTKDLPEKVILKPCGGPGLSKKHDATAKQDIRMEIEECLAIDFNIQEVPREVNWQKLIPMGSDLWEWQMVVCKLFDEQPIWLKNSLSERLHGQGLTIVDRVLRKLLFMAAYYFSNGPFLRLWIRKGYDPRKDPESRIYQRMDYRVPPSLRSFCDTTDASGLETKWEDVCAFRVFPRKCHILLHLYELKDDYIQQEIRKPASQESCSLQTGWLSSRVLDCLRLRVAQRFLSVCPEPGAESLLKSVSKRFEKTKRLILKMDMKVDKDGEQQHKEVLENQDTEKNDDFEHEEDNDDEMDDNIEEDADEPLDLVDQDGEFPLQADSYHENISKDYLQDLFTSFPLDTPDGDGMQDADDPSDGMYQIYEQCSDDDSGDEDY